MGIMIKSREFEFSIEHEGRVFSARRTVTGTTTLRQVIHFQQWQEPDDATYAKGQEDVMLGIAKLILFQLVTRGSIRGSRHS